MDLYNNEVEFDHSEIHADIMRSKTFVSFMAVKFQTFNKTAV